MAVVVKKSKDLTLADKLSRLTFTQACDLLGGPVQGKKLLYAGGKIPADTIRENAVLIGDLFRFSLPHENAVVTITLRQDQVSRLLIRCDQCPDVCVHMGMTLSTILECKVLLGLARAPEKRQPVESLTEEQLIERALEERTLRAKEERMLLEPVDVPNGRPWGDYVITSKLSGKAYRLALRGSEPGESYCTCPDYRTNTLGTCKHILNALNKLQRKYGASALRKKAKQKETCVYLRYGIDLALRLAAPDRVNDSAARVIGPIRDVDISDVNDLIRRVDSLERLGEPVVIYPDAEEFIQFALHRQRLSNLVEEIRRDPARNALRKTLLKVELLPYQLDGIAFAAGAGRAILADDMGLGKTIQGVGVAELLAREAQIDRVLVICPTSLKSQWRNEIQRFSNRDVQLVMGNAAERARQYREPAFFTVCNYEQVLRDIMTIESTRWDLIILDEGQRIKNWEAQTTRVVKSLKSRFALVLSGTPLENRLDELYSVVQFVDGRHLGPGFRFFNKYRITDDKGFVLGYQKLNELREQLKPILLRRTRDMVMKDLPTRNMEIIHIPPTEEQRTLHGAHMQIVASITRKSFISEMDLLRLRQALMMCRMAADSTYLCDKQGPGYSTKLQVLDELFEQLFVEGEHKAVLFSEWTNMLNLIEPLLKKRGVQFVRLEGKIPQSKRQQIVHEFQTNPDCRVFLSTNAGSTGLNLQAADTVINVDLPWNPAVLEQRIARAHRMGQKRPVNIYVLVTEKTLEEELLKTISQKKELAMAALDSESDISEINLQSGMDELKSRLEVLLGAMPEGHLDASQKRDKEKEAVQLADQRRRMADAGGQMLTATFEFLGQMFPRAGSSPSPEAVNELRDQLSAVAETDEHGQKSLKINLPSEEALTQFAETLARLLSLRSPEISH
ncbi:MAG: DEAD/DEAH box helicase [Planctomyces sp.]|nr:DEAD/DEAH box helicase [Planctomyces sp.]